MTHPDDDPDFQDWFASVTTSDDPVPTNGRTRPRATGVSWRPVDLRPILDGSRTPPEATILTRTDGQGLIYPARTHSLVGESEAAKSWLAQYACAQQLLAGNACIYLDFEDSAESVTDRMLTLGMTDKLLLDRWAYIAPEEPIEPAGRGELADALADLKPSIVIIDGVTEAMSLHSLKSNDNDDLATFGRMVARPIAATGAAVTTLDHQPKDRENRGRYALGGVHKLNGLSGAAIIADNVAPFGTGLRGITRLRIAKDRPGQLRAHGLHAEGGMRWIGDFILDTRDQAEPAFIQPPTEAQKAAEEWRPTVVMEKVSEAFTKAKRPLTKSEIRDRVKARAALVQSALAVLVDEGYVEEKPGPRGSTLHTLVRPYAVAEDSPMEPEDPEW